MARVMGRPAGAARPYVYRRFVTTRRIGLLGREMRGWTVWSSGAVHQTTVWTSSNPVSAWISRVGWCKL